MRNLEDLRFQMKIKPEEVSLSLENFIREHVEKLERDGVILGLSGGIDSAVLAALCKRAVGPERTLALIMPEKDSEYEHIKDALDFVRELGIGTKLINLTPYLKNSAKSHPPYDSCTTSLPLSKAFKFSSCTREGKRSRMIDSNP